MTGSGAAERTLLRNEKAQKNDVGHADTAAKSH